MAKEKGLTVYANDILKINYYIAQALIENNDKTIDDKDISKIFSGEATEGFMFQNFADQYYFQMNVKILIESEKHHQNQRQVQKGDGIYSYEKSNDQKDALFSFYHQMGKSC
jgi:adenine-specific DNA methylase